MKNHLQTGATIRLALRGEHALLQGIMRRASLVSETYRDELLAHPEAMSLPVEQIAEGAVFVAETQGTVDGFCVVIMLSVDEAELEGLFVEPDRWRKGIGRALVEHGAGAARARGAASITVVAGPEARAFYERCGFAYESDATTLFGSAVLMRRRLAGR